jgi:rare lipoprotein A
MQAAAPPSTPVLADTTPAAGEPLPVYVQAGAFSTEANATRLLGQLRERGFNEAFVREDVISGQRLYRVRIGPLANAEAFDDVVRQLNALGVSDARLAAD